MKIVHSGFQWFGKAYLPTEIYFFNQPAPGRLIGELIRVVKFEVLEK